MKRRRENEAEAGKGSGGGRRNAAEVAPIHDPSQIRLRSDSRAGPAGPPRYSVVANQPVSPDQMRSTWD